MCDYWNYVFQEVLGYVSKLLEVIVPVHFGRKRPLVYKDDKVNVYTSYIRVQCLDGGHYNLGEGTSWEHGVVGMTEGR